MSDRNEYYEREKAYYDKNTFIGYNHIELSCVDQDHVEVYVDLVPESLNGMGKVHGGMYFTMCDYCGLAAARTDGRRYVTQSAAVNYLTTVSEGRITAKADVVRRGRATCLVEVNVYSDKDKLLFNAMVTAFCIEGR